MTLKETLIAKIETLPEDLLMEVYNHIENLEAERQTNGMAELRKIKISAAPDFSTTATLYPYPPENDEK